MITNAGLKKFGGWALVTSPFWLLGTVFVFLIGFKGVVFILGGTLALLSAVVAGILLLDSASRTRD